MSEIPGDLKFLKSHEWARVEDNGHITVGISDHAQAALGDLVYVELPGVGDTVQAGNGAAVVESVKAASDVYAPIAGEVVAANEELEGSPELLNKDPYGAWMFKLKPDSAADLGGLMDAGAYAAHVESEAH